MQLLAIEFLIYFMLCVVIVAVVTEEN